MGSHWIVPCRRKRETKTGTDKERRTFAIPVHPNKTTWGSNNIHHAHQVNVTYIDDTHCCDGQNDGQPHNRASQGLEARPMVEIDVKEAHVDD